MALSLIVSCQSKCDTTIYAADDHKIEIYFDAGSGVYDDGLHARVLKFLPGYTWKDIQRAAPGAADIDCGDSVFNGWKLNNDPIPENHLFNEDTLLTADYTVIKRLSVTIDPTSDGYWEGTTSSDPKTTIAIEGETWGKYYDSYVVTSKDSTTKEFKFWSVNDETTALQNDYVLQDGDKIKANFGTLDETNSFTTDSWPVFIHALNKGYDSIHDNGHAEGGYSEDLVDDSFVGLERTIRIYNKDYKVRVIGENVDPMSEHSGNATLTFQFVDAIENAVGWNSEDDNTYNSASIRTYLNEQFIDALPDDIIENIVPVNKYTYSGGLSSSIVTTSEKMFLPSLRELLKSEITSFTIGEGAKAITIGIKAEGIGADHTDPYEYYGSADEGDFLKKQYNGVGCNYWLRSPDDEGLGQAWYIDNNGIIGSNKGSYSVQYGLGISPCFALGEFYEE